MRNDLEEIVWNEADQSVQECVVVQMSHSMRDIKLGAHFYIGKILRTSLVSQTRARKSFKAIVKIAVKMKTSRKYYYYHTHE